MGRIIQQKGIKGSLRWIQHVVNDCPGILSNPVIDAIGADKGQPVEWLSPKTDDDYSEYRDQNFLDLLGINLAKTRPSTRCIGMN